MNTNRKIKRFLLLIIASASFITHMTPAHTQEKKLSRSFNWREWYYFRKNIVYPLNHFVYVATMCVDNPTDILGETRTTVGYENVPDICNTGNSLLTAQFGVGIVDAWLADKPTKEIVTDDIARFIVFYSTILAIDRMCPALLHPDIAKKPLVRAITYVCKYNVASIVSALVGIPLGSLAYHAVKGRKSRTRTASHQKTPAYVNIECPC